MSQHRSAHTSLVSYQEIVEDGTLSKQERAVVAAIFIQGPSTRDQIAARAGIRLSAVCGRVRELLDTGVLEVCGTIKSPDTGMSQQILRIVKRQRELALA